MNTARNTAAGQVKEGTKMEASDPDFDLFVAGPALCAILAISRDSLRRLRLRGLPHVGGGRLRRYHLGRTIAWLNENS